MLDPNSEFNRDFYYKPEATILSVSLSKEVGGLREDFHNLFDGDFMLRYTNLCAPIYTNITLVHYRIHELSKTIATAQRMYEEYFTILDEHHTMGSIKWFNYILKKAGFLSTRYQNGKSRLELLQIALKLLMTSPYVLIARAYWGLWRKILTQTSV